MKKQAYTTIAMMILAGFVAMSSAKAQTSASRQLTANIPFEFSVGNKTLTAGEYFITCVNPESDLKVLRIENKNRRGSVLVLMRATEGHVQESSKLVFHRYGDRYFFAQAWTTGDSEGLEAPRSRAERGMVERLAGIAPTNESIALASRK